MELKPATKINLNRYSHSARASQLVLQYGVGAMIDFPNQTLMTAAPEYWQEQVKHIHDERLEKVLHVDYFGVPGGQDDEKFTEGVSYARFPEWYFCPKCRKFKPLKDWIKEYKRKATQKKLDNDPEMTKYLECPTCKQDLVVSRIVTACECGHIDDFPWVNWVHCQNRYGAKPVCDKPSLTFKTSATSAEGLEGLTIACERCNATATLRGAFSNGLFAELDRRYEGKYDFHCTGRHPWKNTKESCGRFPKVLQRGGSSVYFPITASSLVIPPYSSLITEKVEKSSAFDKAKNTIADLRKNPAMAQMLKQYIEMSIDQYAKDIGLETGIDDTQVKSILERKWLSDSVEECSTDSVKYRYEEYEALSGRVAMKIDDYGDFMREPTDIENYGIPAVSNISLIHKIREVQAQIGFSRLMPVEQTMYNDGTEYAVSIKQNETNWYPAYEVRGEGIFIEFDESKINKWIEDNPEVNHRVDILTDNYAKSFIGKSHVRKVTAKFILLHTISHLLIKQLSFECGYSIASLKERLYCNDDEESGKKMSGILIYTASGDSEGTMGGLVRQGRADTFPSIFRKAIESAVTCSNDPVCNFSMGQGRDSLNLAACYSCSLIPETSCEEFNVFLDRACVVGTYKNKEMGFYHEQIYGNKAWKSNEKTGPKTEVKKSENNMDLLIITEMGTDMRDMKMKDIWENQKQWSDNAREINVLNQLIAVNANFGNKEMPYQNCKFLINGQGEAYNCDLMWVESKVALFTEENADNYEKALKSDWKAFLTTQEDFNVEDFIGNIMEV